MARKDLIIDVQMPVDKNAWLNNGGGHGWATPAPTYIKESMEALLPWLPSSQYSGTFSADDLRHAVQQEFRQPTVPPQSPAELLDRAFTSLKILSEQIHLTQCSSLAITEGIRIDVCSAYVGSQTDLDPTYDPEQDAQEHPPKQFYTYRVRISNVGYVFRVIHLWCLFLDDGLFACACVYSYACACIL